MLCGSPAQPHSSEPALAELPHNLESVTHSVAQQLLLHLLNCERGATNRMNRGPLWTWWHPSQLVLCFALTTRSLHGQHAAYSVHVRTQGLSM